MNPEINKKIEEVKREIEIEIIEYEKKWVGSTEYFREHNPKLISLKSYLKGLEEAKKSYDDEMKKKIDDVFLPQRLNNKGFWIIPNCDVIHNFPEIFKDAQLKEENKDDN